MPPRGVLVTLAYHDLAANLSVISVVIPEEMCKRGNKISIESENPG
jgi:hypothetical protein